MPYSCWTTATSKPFSTSALSRQPVGSAAAHVCTTPGPGDGSWPLAPTRTTPPSPRWAARAELKVASPQRVGGWVLRNPYLMVMVGAFRSSAPPRVEASVDLTRRLVSAGQRVWRANGSAPREMPRTSTDGLGDAGTAAQGGG